MFGILWLTLWATVGEAFYDDYWFDHGNAGIEGLAFGSKRNLKHNFTESLKSFHKLYNAAREGPDDAMTMAKAKFKLKALKVFRHNGKHIEIMKSSSLPLRDGAKYCTMGRHTKVDCNHCTCVAGQMYMCTGLICPTPYGRPTFLATCREGVHRKIDACNFCFCRNGHEICTNKDCSNLLQFSLRSRCPEGHRLRRGCNRCLCLRGEEYCTNHRCNDNLQDSSPENLYGYWDTQKCQNGEEMKVNCKNCICVNRKWSCKPKNCFDHPIHKDDKRKQCEEGEILVDYCNICYCRRGKLFCENNNCGYLKGQKFSMKRNGKQCIEGSKYDIDECNYCVCIRGREECTDLDCGVNSLSYQRSRICLQGDIKKQKCNYCYCFLGNWLCTPSHCSDDFDKKNNNHISIENMCEKGQTKNINCNTCECHDGEWICSLLPCSTKETDQHKLLPLRNQYHSPVGCKQDEENYIGCNLCFCNNREWVCTQRKCDESDEYYQDVGFLRPEKLADTLFYLEPCTSGEQRHKDKCNLCYCANEKWFCQINYCGKNVDIMGRERISEPIFGEPSYTAKCRKGARRQKDVCNTCYCRHKMWFCENKACANIDEVPEILYVLTHKEGREICNHGSIQMIHCNECQCRESSWYCTLKTCAGYEAEAIKTGLKNGTCVSGIVKRLHKCKVCHCVYQTWYCSLTCIIETMRFSELEVPPRNQYDLPDGCKKNEEKKVGCNHCLCNDREWLCTQRKCDVSDKYDHVDLLRPEELADTLFHLQPCSSGEKRYKDKCNLCYCANKKWFCQMNYCGKSVDIMGRQRKVAPSLGGPQSFYTAKCRKGARRKKDACNTCFCRHKIWFCENKACTNIDEEPDRLTMNQQILTNKCKIGHVLNLDCYTCVCMARGYHCTMKKKCRVDPKTGKPWLRTSKCKVGSKYPIDECNYCFCMENDEYICTNITCGPDDSFNPIMKSYACEIGKKEPIDSCNYCYCTSDQMWDCTNNYCPGEREHSYLRHEQRKCLVGTRYRLDACNYCYCDYDRNLVCSNHSCPQYHIARTSHNCEVGERQRVDPCNHCVCSTDGVWDCTSNYCPEHIARTIYFGNPESIWSTESEFLMPEPCVNGARKQIDACNYCVCLDNRQYCSKKNCNTKAGSYFLEPPCSSGEPLPQLDPCNECICLDGAIVCSKKACTRTTQEASNTRSRMCEEGDKFFLEDGCNYCVCSGGQEFCTSRACMMVHDTNAKCNEGDIIPAKDHCNMCVCVHGKVTCTNKICRKIGRQGQSKRRSGFRFKKFGDPTSPSNIKPEHICVEGFFYNPDNYDPKCPNICVCDRRELLCTDRKCGNKDKELPPEWGSKSVKHKHKKLALKQTGCVDYQSLPSDEPCSHCHCLNNRKVCNITRCVQDKEEMIAKSVLLKKPLEPLPEVFCTPFTFFSPDNNRFCRNCFCLHNGLAICLLNFCKYSKDVPHKEPESIHDMCNPGEIGYPTKCVSCKCSENGKWVCSRERLSDCDERNCDVRDEFQMGFQTFCASCKCASKEWYCAIEEGQCSDYSDLPCPMGTFMHNPNQFCSVCLCGGLEGSKNMCFTESKCVKQVVTT